MHHLCQALRSTSRPFPGLRVLLAAGGVGGRVPITQIPQEWASYPLMSQVIIWLHGHQCLARAPFSAVRVPALIPGDSISIVFPSIPLPSPRSGRGLQGETQDIRTHATPGCLVPLASQLRFPAASCGAAGEQQQSQPSLVSWELLAN